MAEIVLATLNAKYVHAAFGLRYLQANLGPLESKSRLLEFTLESPVEEVVARISREEPRVVGISVAIWNRAGTLEVLPQLRAAIPGAVIVLGGPEVSHELDGSPFLAYADHVIQGEGELAFAELCAAILEGRPAPSQVLQAPLPALDKVALPYRLYSADDLAHRLVYVESSRGCPFSCEFCLSSLTPGVRSFELEPFLAEMQGLLERGARKFKFVDRTFNLDKRRCLRVLDFFLARLTPGLFLHFEVVPDRLAPELLEKAREFPPGVLQFEIGIQTFREDVAALIQRRQDNAKAETTLRLLRETTSVHLHADLIFGLPGEDLASFAKGFDRLLALGPHEIQLGILKRLRGTTLLRHSAEWGLQFSPEAPYEVTETRLLCAETVARVRRMARYWELLVNAGRFPRSVALLWRDGQSAFEEFLRLSDWLYAETGMTHGLSLDRLAELLLRYLARERALAGEEVCASLREEFEKVPGRRLPLALRS